MEFSRATEFLEDLEPLSREDRIKRTVELGRQALTDKNALLFLTTLSYSGVVYERYLGALGLRFTVPCTETERLLKDPYECVASLAIQPAAKSLSDSSILRLFDVLPLPRLCKFCAALEAEGRATALADAYLRSGKSLGKRSPAQTLLSWASEDCLTSLPLRSLRSCSSPQLRVLTRRCPAVVAKLLEEELSKDNGLLPGVRRRADVVFQTLRRHHPEIGLKLLETVFKNDVVTNDVVNSYARLYPTIVAELILPDKRRFSIRGKHVTREISADLLVALSENDALMHYSLSSLFARLSRTTQAYLYAQHREALAEGGEELPLWVVEKLPPPHREKETLFVVNRQEKYCLSYWASYLFLLPFPRAFDFAKDYLKTSDVNQRALVCRELLKCGNLYPEHLNEIIDFCVARENECDPVWGSMLSALSTIHGRHWRAEKFHLERLALIVQKAQDRRDVSNNTLSMALRVVLRTASHSTVLIDKCLLSLVEQVGLNTELRHYKLPAASVERIWGCLLPWMAKVRGNSTKQGLLTSTIRNFYSHLHDVRQNALPFLRTLCDSQSAEEARFGFTTLFKHFRSEAVRSVPELLRASPDWITVHEIRHLVCKSLQGALLDPYLHSVSLQGIFMKNTIPTLVVLPYGYYWTAKRQMKYAKSVIAYLTSPDYDRSNMDELVKNLATLSSGNFVEALTPYIQVKSANMRLRDLLIHLLGELKDSQSLKFLGEALADERSRIAIYGIRRRIRNIPTEDIIAFLRDSAECKKVTVQKEAIRIIGELGDETAYTYLLQLFNAGPLHRDVHIAWLRAMHAFTDKEEVWEFFYKAAENEFVGFAVAASSISLDNVVEEWQHRARGKLMSILLAHPKEEVVYATMQRLVEVPLCVDIPEVTAQLVKLMHTLMNHCDFLPAEALIASCMKANDLAKLFCDVTKDSVLLWISIALRNKVDVTPERIESIVRFMIDHLLACDRQPAIISRLITILPPGEWYARISALARRCLLHPGVVFAFLKDLKRRNSEIYNCREVGSKEWRKVEEQLRRDTFPYIRRIGLAVLCYLTRRERWQKEDRVALEEYCQDVDHWVSEGARVISPY